MDLTSTFNAVSNPSGDAGAVASGPDPAGPISPSAADAPVSPSETPVIQPEPPPMLNVEGATAEKEALEAGRSAPANNLNVPPPPFKKAVDARADRQREARIAALNAYVQSQQNKPAPEADHDQGEELEFRL